MRVGFVGLGNMGRPMAERLLQSGWDLTVHNRTPARTAPLVERWARASRAPSRICATATS